MDLSDLKTRVKREFGDDAGVQLVSADLVRWANDGQREIAMQNEDILQTIATTNVTANDDEYTFPTDLLMLRSIRLSGFRLKYLSLSEMDEYIDGYQATPAVIGPGTPEVFTIFGGSFTLFPMPSTTITNGLKVFYTRKPVDLSADDDEIDLPIQYHNVLVNYVLQKAYQLDEDWQAAQAMQSQVQNDLGILKQRTNYNPNERYPRITVLREDEGTWY